MMYDGDTVIHHMVLACSFARLGKAKEEKEELRFAVLRLLRAGPEKDLEKNLAAVMKDLRNPLAQRKSLGLGMCAGCERIRSREDSGCCPED